VLDLDKPRQFRLRCANCPACCRTVRVPLTHYDVSRLVAATSFDVEQIVEWLKPDDIDMSGEPESFVELNDGRRLLVLRHNVGACLFLSPKGCCAFYNARPATCAAYPFSIERKEGISQLTLLSDAPCSQDSAIERIRESEERAAAWCAAGRVEEELRDYLKKVAQWNRQQHRRKLARRLPRNAFAYFEFLGFRRTSEHESC
jgi:Fe-S-cluster containining protein